MKDNINPLSEFTRVPGAPGEVAKGNLPPGAMYTSIVTQELLDECARALRRPLWDFEVKVLDMMLLAQGKANIKLAAMGKPERTHSADEIVHLFCECVNDKEMDARLKRVMYRFQHGDS